MDIIWIFKINILLTDLEKDSNGLEYAISSNKIEIDYYKSNWVLYRNSTTVLNAVMCKLKPIYLKFP